MGAFSACGPLDVIVFEASETEERAPPPVVLGLGGRQPTDDGMGGAPAVTSFLLDDFEDEDLKANDPGGWWYTVNDGTGTQEFNLRSSSNIAVPQSLTSLVLESHSQAFTQWGAAWGVDVNSAADAQSAFEVRFDIAAAQTTDVDFHAIDGSGTHFIRTLRVTSTWTTTTVRLDELFVVEGQSVRGLDVTTATELQWFVFSEAPTTVWLDNVWLRYW